MAFGLFLEHLCTQAFDATELNLDGLIAAYIQADYVDCPAFADVAFVEICLKTSPWTHRYTADQILYTLTNTIADQLLRILLLDQVGLGLMQAIFNFDSAEQELLELVAANLLLAVVSAGQRTMSSYPSYLLPRASSIGSYLRHVCRRTSSRSMPGAAQPTKPFEMPAIIGEKEELEIGRKAIERAVRRSGPRRESAIRAFKSQNYDTSEATQLLQRPVLGMFGDKPSITPTFSESPLPSTTAPSNNSTANIGSISNIFANTDLHPTPTTQPFAPTQGTELSALNQNTTTPAAGRSRSTTTARGARGTTIRPRGQAVRGRGGYTGFRGSTT